MGQRYLELTRTRLTVMLAIYHEAITKTALAEASGEFCLPLRIPSTSRAVVLMGWLPASTPANTTPAPSSSTEKNAPKLEPVKKRDHLNIAADLMSDIQVETYSSMDKREKTEL